MRKIESLKKPVDFKEAYNKGMSFSCKELVIFKKENELNYNRLGVSISKKVGNSVVRHRIKRLIKEIMRLKDSIKSGYDIVFIVRKPAVGKTYQELEKSVDYLINKACLCEKF